MSSKGREEISFLLPDLENEDGAGFWEGTGREQLLVQTCADCDAPRFPPRPMCPQCRSLKFSWIPSSGRGTIWSFVVVHAPVLPAYQDLVPYPVIVVELAENSKIRMVGNLVTGPDGAINEIDPATIVIGESVRVVFKKVDDVMLPVWMRIADSQ